MGVDTESDFRRTPVGSQYREAFCNIASNMYLRLRLQYEAKKLSMRRCLSQHAKKFTKQFVTHRFEQGWNSVRNDFWEQRRTIRKRKFWDCVDDLLYAVERETADVLGQNKYLVV